MKGLFGIGSRGNGVSRSSSLLASSLLAVAHCGTLPGIAIMTGTDYLS